jgi:hypothetical protein
MKPTGNRAEINVINDYQKAYEQTVVKIMAAHSLFISFCK